MKLNIVIVVLFITFTNCFITEKKSNTDLKRTERFRITAGSESYASMSKKFYSKLKERDGESIVPKRIENASWLSVGYNLMKGNPKVAPANGKIMDNGFTSQIFKLNFEQKNQTPDDSYIFPDGYEVQPAKACQTNFSSRTIKTSTDLKSDLSASLGIEASGWGASFSMNAEYKQMSNKMKNSNALYISNNAECSIYRAALQKYAPPPFTKNFLAGLQVINEKDYRTDPDAFHEDFTKSFGTHYFKTLLMGSRYTYIEETTNTAYTDLKTSGVDISLEAKYSAATSVGGGGSAKTKIANSNQQKYENAITNKYITTIGAPMPESMDMKDWIKGSYDYPMPISYTILPIYELMKVPAIVKDLKEKGLNAEGLYSNLKLAYDGYCIWLKSKNLVETCESVGFYAEREIYTSWEDDEGAKIEGLAKHNIACEDGEILNGFSYQNGGKNKIRFKIECVKSEIVSKQCENKQTPPGEIAGRRENSLHFLDRHPIVCEGKKLLKRIQLKNTGGKINFEYTCCEISIDIMQCVEGASNKKKSPEFKTIDLQDYPVWAGDGYALQKILFINNAETNYYSYTKCKIKKLALASKNKITKLK